MAYDLSYAKSSILIGDIFTATILPNRTQELSTVKILASLVPDEIIYTNPYAIRPKTFSGVLLCVDVSGFTELCEKYSKIGKGGPSRITQVLNAYIGAMVQEIISHSGDILKFSGDAFLALWKCSDDISMSDVVHAAIDCALGIQRSYGVYRTDVGVILRVKIAVAAGQIMFVIIGDNNFMVLGNTMLEVKDLGTQCGPGDIIISSTVRMFIAPNEYIIDTTNSYLNARILTIGSDWSPSALGNQYEMFDAFTSTTKNVEIDESDLSLVIVHDDDDEEEKPYFYSYLWMTQSSHLHNTLRPSIDFAVEHELSDFMRRFIIAPVLNAVDLNEPLDYLTEMRQVVIVFFNIVTQTFNIRRVMHVCIEAQAMIYSTVTEKGGILNKISMFDKDLMFLVIFGLRGFKHKLEAQRALFCAKYVRDRLAKVENVETCSVGICTGMTYCGVVGHPMRKEYTVIGATVNKAARLMCAYPDMVTCDRQTFLQSGLQARKFMLQPPRILKGIVNVGPIYSFHDRSGEGLEIERLRTQRYPILDRHREIQLFLFLFLHRIYGSKESLLRQILPSLDVNTDYCMMIVKAKERQGKTRLVNELEFRMSRSHEFYTCYVYPDSPKYVLYNTMFAEKCNLREKNINKRTENVRKLLGNFKVPEFLCSLNDILNVNFPSTKYYERLTDSQRIYVARKMIKYLCVKAFKTKCIVAIDNIELMDDDSWKLFSIMLNLKIIFFFVTLGDIAKLNNLGTHILKRRDIVTVDLECIDKLQHAALICQFLNVSAVPLELERYIHLHSNGNPGWIESFLTTLFHSKGLDMITIRKERALEEGFVVPSYDSLYRDTTRIFPLSSTALLDKKEGSFLKIFDLEIEGWDIFHQTIKDHDLKPYENIPDDIPVCIIPQNFNLNLMITEDQFDVPMLKTYDSLKVQEQQTLKCSAVLGDVFERSMLEYIMQFKNERTLALAIMRLFEIRVFSCARARFVEGAIQVEHYLQDPNDLPIVDCYCIGFTPNQGALDLPKYAHCGYMRFREPLFRQMLVNLLTESQANLYHVRAMWYLESKTRRCLACGSGFFTTTMGQTNDDGMKRISIDQIPSLVRMKSLRNEMNRSFEEEIETTSMRNLESTLHPFEFNTNLKVMLEKDIRTFVDNNLIDCECEVVLINMYTQMIQHCFEAGCHDKLMFALLEYANLCINTLNIVVAFTLLEKATELLDTILTEEFSEPSWQIPITRGKIRLLHGQLHLERGAFFEAERCMLESLSCYNLEFPNTRFRLRCRLLEKEVKQRVIVEIFPNRFIGSKDEDVCILADQTAEVLNSLYALYRKTLQYDKAYLASIWSANEALRSDSNFYIMCTSYANIMTMDMIYTRSSIMDKIEDMALTMCFRKHTRLEKHELVAVLKLYGAIFCRLCLCINVRESLKVGYVIVKLNSPEFGGNYKWLMLPLMAQALICTKQIIEAASLIQQTNYYKEMNESVFAPMMYYILCIEFRLYTTLSIEPFDDCLSLVRYIMSDNSKKIVCTIEMRYHVAIWLWYLRKGNWHSANSLIMHVKRVVTWPFIQEPSMIYVMLHLLEGFLHLLVRVIDTHDYNVFEETEADVLYLMNTLKSISKKLTCIKSRYLILKAYYHMIYKRRRRAMRILDKAMNIAKKCGITFEIDWMLYLKRIWQRAHPEHYVLHSEYQRATEVEVIVINWEEEENENLNIPYHLFPLPKVR